MVATIDVATDIKITKANLDNPKHANDIVNIIDMFAKDPMGQDKGLKEEVKSGLIDEMKKIPTTKIFVAYRGEQILGVITGFIGFSTFTAKKTYEIHDIVVHPEARGLGIGTRLLEKVENEAKEMDCAKINLEVRTDNPAQKLYERKGFDYGSPKWWYMTKELDS